MSGVTAFIYSDEYLKYDFGPFHPFRPDREKRTLELLRRLGVIDGVRARVYEARAATEEELMLVHDPEYIRFVKEKSEQGYGLLDYGDTPATRGIYEGAAARAGGSLLGADLIMRGEVAHAFNPGGGLHHARRNSAAGFCVFNDVALAARHLQRKYGLERIAIVDIDGHHGDGTQEIFNREKVLTISFHR
ncbi:MAG: arginase family protein, partial [Candidatus Alkanophagales archaeon]